MKRLLFIFLLLPVFSAAQINKDSLWSVWKDASIHDTIRLKAIDKLAWKGFMFSEPDSAFTLGKLAYDHAEKRSLKKYMTIALNTQGVALAVRGKSDEAIVYFENCASISLELKNPALAASSLNNIGLIYKNKGDFRKAIDNYTRSLKIQEKARDTSGILAALNNISILYIEMHDTLNAYLQLNECLKYIMNSSDLQSAAITYNNFGRYYESVGRPDEAIQYFKTAVNLFIKVEDRRNVGFLYSNIGVIYRDIKQIDSALYYLNKSLEIGNELKDDEVTGFALINLGVLYQKSDPARAITYGLKADEIAFRTNSISLKKANAELLYKAYKEMGQHEKSLEKYELFIGIKDSLESEANQKEIIRQQYKYEYEKETAKDSIKAAGERKVIDAQLAQQEAEIKNKNTRQVMLYCGLVVVIFFAGFMYNRFRITNRQKEIIEEQKHIVEEKNREILDSITYAKRIQSAILPPDKVVKEYLKDSFVLYKPKDIVAGDFYWMEFFAKASGSEGSNTKQILFAACDCTGHGVPGAMVSVVCNNGLNRAVREFGLTDPGKILDKTREIVLQEFEKSEEEVNDGMDVSLAALVHRAENENGVPNSSHTLSTFTLKWAGANNPLWLIRCVSLSSDEGSVSKTSNNYELIEYKPDKQPIGNYAHPKPFTTHEIELQKGDSIYIFTDGFQDQFGGDRGKKLKAKAFKELLLSIQDKDMSEQRMIINDTFEKWKGNLEQNDDICVIGVRV